MRAPNNDITVVVFRKWLGGRGDILALFPEVPATLQGHCLSYEHLGQHGGADYMVCIRQTRPASRLQYAGLKKELESCYGYKLRVVRRAARTMAERRLKAARSGT